MSATAPRLVWTAGRTGVAHAGRGRDQRTLCGQLRAAPAFSWPLRSRCPECWRLALEGGWR